MVSDSINYEKSTREVNCQSFQHPQLPVISIPCSGIYIHVYRTGTM